MDMEELGYFLYMESKDLQNKSYEDVKEYEKVNLELNPFLECDLPTKADISEESVEYPKNIPLP